MESGFAFGTYVARVVGMLDVCGPPSWPSLLASDAEVRGAQELLRGERSVRGDAARGALAAGDEAALSRARYLVRAAVHPDTEEIIPLPFRMAAHVPANAVLLVGMLSARSVLGTGAWQFANQAFNALQFYANRNATAATPSGDSALLASFSGAVASSVGVGVLLRRSALRAEAAAAVAQPHLRAAASRSAAILSLGVPFLAAAAGKPLQIGLMRHDEWLGSGVEVFTADGQAQGRSIAAGRAAVAMTILTRSVYLAPMLWLPVLQSALERSVPLLQRSRPARIASYTIHAAANSAFVTPLCIALFDQRASLPAAALEPRFHGASGPLYFNKGL
jgi:hypothetical protein